MNISPLALSIALAGFAAAPQARAAGIDWASIQGKRIVLFAPGQTPWEWALTADDMSGATKFLRHNKACVDCHDGKEQTMGRDLVVNQTRQFTPNGKPAYDKPSREPNPIAGRPGYIVAVVKFAHDADNMYVHLDVKDGTQPNAGQDLANATKVTVMFTGAKTDDVVRAGCEVACHDDMTNMPSANGATRTHYLAGTRARLTRQGGGDTLKDDAALAKLKAAGYYLEDWQAKLNPGQPAQTAAYIVFTKREAVPLPLTVDASTAGGVTSVTLSGKLTPNGGYLGFTPGTLYHVAFAVHEGHTAGRYHYISLAKSLLLDTGFADFVVAKQ